MSILVDAYGRPVDRLRVSVTYACNYRCIFCHFEGLGRHSRVEEALSAEDYGFLAKVLSRYSVKYYKLTGGEPLIRSDIHEVVANIKRYAEEVSLVTNGSLLLEKAKALAEAGLDRVNVSIHSLREGVYEYITGGSRLLEKVLMGVREALERGLRVKVNFLLMRSNADDLPMVIDFAESRGLDINIIEMIPIGVPRDIYLEEHIPVTAVIEYIEGRSVSKKYREFQNRVVYILSSGIKVEVVIGYENPFMCSTCTRMRFTPEGCFKTCLYVDNPLICVTEAIKSRDERALEELFRKAVEVRKPFSTWSSATPSTQT